MSDQWIRASEIPTYVYCRRAWWLKRRHHVPAQNVRQLDRGSRYHQHHGRMVWQSFWARRAAYVVLFFLVAFLVYQLLL